MISKTLVAKAVGAVAVLAAIHSAPTIAKAGNQMMDAGQRMARIRHAVDDLGLSDEQKSKIKEVIQSEAEKAQGTVLELERNHAALRVATDDGASDRRVHELAAKEGRLVSELTVDIARTKRKVFVLLTSDQKDKIRADEARIEDLVESHRFGSGLEAVLK